MIRNTESFNHKSIHLLILAVSPDVGLAEPYQAFASSNSSNDGDNSGSSGKSREDLINQLCRFVSDNNPAQAELAASALGFPGDAGAAANALCSLGSEK
jgi:hypothetical protein